MLDQQSAWDAYWRDERGGACQTDASGQYRGVIARFWQQVFGGLLPGNRVLDLATGNGAVVELAVAGLSVDQLPMAFYGVDRARILPRLERRPRPGIECRFFAGVDNKAVPFAAGMFDLITSQYGVEYGDVEATLAECSRLLATSGRIVWVCHWRNGDLARSAAEEVERIRAIKGLDLTGKVADLVRHQIRDGRFIADSHQATRGLAVARRMQESLGEAFRLARTRPGQKDGNLSVFLHNLAYLYQHRTDHEPAIVFAKLDEAAAELDYHDQRLSALCRAALTPADVQRLERALVGQGFAVGMSRPLKEEATQRVVGYAIEAARGEDEQLRRQLDDRTRQQRLASKWSWSDYWKQGAATTFERGRYEAGYDGAVLRFWHQVLDTLKSDARILDVATGNGAIAYLAARRAQALQRRWQIVGIDSAAIEVDPEEAGPDDKGPDSVRQMVQLLGHTPVEKTGLPEVSFDLIVSQFGFEYADQSKAIAEISRLLRPGGRLAMVMHHPESAVVGHARGIVDGLNKCLDEQGFDRKVAAVVKAEYQVGTGMADPEELGIQRQSLRDAVGALGLENVTSPLARTLQEVVAHFLSVFKDKAELPASARLEFIEEFSWSVRAFKGRMEAMVESTRTATEIQVLRQALEAAGFCSLLIDQLTEDGRLIGWTVMADFGHSDT